MCCAAGELSGTVVELSDFFFVLYTHYTNSCTEYVMY